MSTETPTGPLECLVGRLREYEGSDALGNGDFSLLREAADEIERLQTDAALFRDLCGRASAQFCTAVRGGADIELVRELHAASQPPNAALSGPREGLSE